MIKTIDVECNAANPNLPLKPMFAFVNSPSSIRVRNVPKRIGDWCIRKVYFTAVYPDSTVKTAECVLTGGVWVGTIEGTNTSGTSTNGYTIFADGTDENGNNVTGYVLGKGDIEILEADGTPSPDPARYTVKLLSAEATQPREGDMYPTDEGYVIWQDGEAHLLGTPFEQITAYVESAVSAKADLSTLEDYVPYTVDRNGYKTAVTVGTRTSEELVGQYSMSIGVLNTLTRSSTLAVGFQNILSNDNSFAVGQTNTVGGTMSFAVGYNNKVQMSKSVAIGDTNTLSAEATQAIGTLNQVSGKYGIALGVKCRANDSGSFVWSGSDKNFAAQFPVYYSHGKGTFNVNPVGGLSGFYVGEQSLNDILSAKTDVSTVHGDYIQDSVGNKIQADGQISAISTYYTVVAFHSDTLGDFTVENDGVWQNELSNAFITAGLAEGMWDISAVNVDIGGELKNGIGYFSTSDGSVVWTEGDLVGDQSIAVNVERQTHHATIAGTLATQTWVLEQLSALQARIAALEGN